MADSLYIKFASTDTGARPITPCGPPNIVWANTSISLSDPISGLTVPGAKVGKPVKINVNVSSNGATFAPQPSQQIFVTVQVWVCDFTIGVGPNAGVASAGGSSGRQGFVTTQQITPQTAGTASVNWTATAGDLLNIDPNTGNGHLCVGANCFWPQVLGGEPPSEGTLMPPPNLLDICGNQHHGQLNIAVIPAGTGMKLKMWNFVNLREPAQFTVNVAEHFRREPLQGRPPLAHLPALGPVEVEQLLAQPFTELRGGTVSLDAVRWGDRGIEDFRNDAGEVELPEPPERAMLRAGGELVLTKGAEQAILHPGTTPLREIDIEGPRGQKGHTIHETIAPHKPIQITFLAKPNRDDRPGAVRAFDVTQRTTQGKLLGGARIVTVNGIT